jgi:hypothetical protein
LLFCLYTGHVVHVCFGPTLAGRRMMVPDRLLSVRFQQVLAGKRSAILGAGLAAILLRHLCAGTLGAPMLRTKLSSKCLLNEGDQFQQVLARHLHTSVNPAGCCWHCF